MKQKNTNSRSYQENKRNDIGTTLVKHITEEEKNYDDDGVLENVSGEKEDI